MTPGSKRVDCCDGVVSFELLEASSADDGDVNRSWGRKSDRPGKLLDWRFTFEMGWEFCHCEICKQSRCYSQWQMTVKLKVELRPKERRSECFKR